MQNTEDRNRLQNQTLFGQEAKPLPYMLVQMNLLLHGLEAPQINYGNTLAEKKITMIGDSERVDVILTNPPFGGEEETGIKANFPPDKQTAETALLFLQYIMRKLNLHTVVRLPQGVFAPYTDIPANLIFFDRQGPTKDIWYYEQPPPEGRKNYSKTAPIQYEEFADCLTWWNNREENAKASQREGDAIYWPIYNLDIKNPHGKEALEHVPPHELVASMLAKEQDVIRLLAEIDALVNEANT